MIQTWLNLMLSFIALGCLAGSIKMIGEMFDSSNGWKDRVLIAVVIICLAGIAIGTVYVRRLI